MEQENAGLGLNDNINETTLLSEEINNIDVHMLKNTEYGAIVLFGASDYGKQGENKEDRYMSEGATSGTEVQASTTGNRYGVYELGYSVLDNVGNRYMNNTNQYEWVAGGTDKTISGAFPNIDARYIDRYTDQESSEKVGDATVETKGWHSSVATWFTKLDYGMIRGNREFGYYSGAASNYPSTTSSNNFARASIVIGEGF